MTERDEVDRELVGRVKGGDDAAFTQLMGHYKGPILNFIYRVIGDSAEAEDVAQDTFVRAYRNLHRFAFRWAGDRFSTWLFQLARNAAIDALRRRQRRPTQSLDVVTERNLPSDRSRQSDPSDQAETKERETLILAAIAALPEDQRTALTLAVYEDLSYAEISKVMRTTEKSVETRLYRARQTLRTRLGSLL